MWGAMQFLKQSPLQQKRRKKVDHWLLMLLRVGLLVLLVLLLAWPRKNRAFSLLGGGGGTDIGIVVDHSLSTGRHAGNSTVYQQAVASVEQFIQSGTLRATDTVSVVLAEHQPNRVTPLPLAPGGVLNKVVGDLRKRKPGLSDGSVPDAIQAAREVIGRGRNGKKVIVVLSDHQRTGWHVPDLTAWNAAVGQRVKGVEPDVRGLRDAHPAGRPVGQRHRRRPDRHAGPRRHVAARGHHRDDRQHRPAGRPRVQRQALRHRPASRPGAGAGAGGGAVEDGPLRAHVCRAQLQLGAGLGGRQRRVGGGQPRRRVRLRLAADPGAGDRRAAHEHEPRPRSGREHGRGQCLQEQPVPGAGDVVGRRQPRRPAPRAADGDEHLRPAAE